MSTTRDPFPGLPGTVSTYNEATAPLLDKLKEHYVPIDFKTAFNKLLELLHNEELDDCIAAGEELLKHRIPDTTRARVHIVLATCVEDVNEMENHYNKAQRLWTLINARYSVGENLRVDQWLREARSQLDAVAEAIEDERNDKTEQPNSTDTSTELTMSAIAVVETVPALRPTMRIHRTSTRRKRSSIASPAHSSSSSASSVSSIMTGSRFFGAVASPGHRALPDHVGMSPASILKLAWDPNRTIRGRTVVTSSKTLPSRPSKRRASSTSETASETPSPSKSPTPARRDTEQYFKSMFEPPSPSTPVAGSKERNGDRRNLSPPKLKLPKGSGSEIRKEFSKSV
ncbi:hypothetical protein KCU65_g8231, partial [Aureobasidium melanogenum]